MRSVIVLAGGTAIAQAIGLAVAPIVTRLYSPADFGILAVYVSLLGILGTVAACRYDLAIPLPKRPESAVNLLAVSFLMVVGVAAVSALIILTIRATGGESSLGTLGAYALLVPIGLIGMGFNGALQYWAIRTKRFRLIARTKLAQAVGQSAAQVVMGLAHLAPFGLLAGHLTGQSGGISAFLRQVWREDRELLESITIDRMRVIGRRYFRFALLATGAGVVNSGGLYAAPLLLAALYGPNVAGWFALADRVIRVPSALVGTSVSQVYFGRVAELAGQPEKLRALLRTIAGRLAMLMALPALAVAVVGKPVFSFVFGADWSNAGVYSQWLAVPMLFGFVVAPVAQNLDVLERQDLSLVWSTARLVIVLVSLIVPWRLGWSAETTIATYALGMSASYVGLFEFNRRAINARIVELRNSRRATGPC